jgi:hypothetical protein
MTTHRELTREEKLVSQYESLVDYICDEYDENIYEYTNDLACRLFIEEAFEQKNESILFMKVRIERADEKLQTVLCKTKKCIYGDFPKTYFWFWGIPENSVELMNEATRNHWL